MGRLRRLLARLGGRLGRLGRVLGRLGRVLAHLEGLGGRTGGGTTREPLQEGRRAAKDLRCNVDLER